MKKYSKIFLPVYAKDADFTTHIYGNNDVPVKELSNVIVMTQEELNDMLYEAWNNGRDAYSTGNQFRAMAFLNQKE